MRQVEAGISDLLNVCQKMRDFETLAVRVTDELTLTPCAEGLEDFRGSFDIAEGISEEPGFVP